MNNVHDGVDVEITLTEQANTRYRLELRLDDGVTPMTREGGLVTFDTDNSLFWAELQRSSQQRLDARVQPDELRNHPLSPLYTAQCEAILAQAQTLANERNVPLRVRLQITPAHTLLHTCPWETLPLPGGQTRLGLSERIRFSRFLSSDTWPSFKLRERSDLRALALIANPADLADYKPNRVRLTHFDVPGEQERLRRSLQGIALTVVAERGQVTLAALKDHLRATPYDIVSVLAHGALVNDSQGQPVPHLWLENEDGIASVVAAADLVAHLEDLPPDHVPRLVVLASCESAGLAGALGPRIAAAGVPAVLAMQGKISTATLERFMPVFFRELQQDGLVDRATAAARNAVRDTLDWWMPALFMRLKGGRLWYTPGDQPEPQAAPQITVQQQVQNNTGAVSMFGDATVNRSDVTIKNQAPNQGSQGVFHGPMSFNYGGGTTLNQGGQTVQGNQYNSGRDMHIGGREQRGGQSVSRGQLRQILTQYVSEAELHDLCFDLELDEQAVLVGNTHADRVKALIRHMHQHERYDDLVAECRRLKPGLLP